MSTESRKDLITNKHSNDFEVVKLALTGNMNQKQIAKETGMSNAYVCKLLKSLGINSSELKSYKQNKQDICDLHQLKILDSISSKDILNASLNEKTRAIKDLELVKKSDKGTGPADHLGLYIQIVNKIDKEGDI